jgi:energy-coupling factor transporter ATP-binding protein EcfA2
MKDPPVLLLDEPLSGLSPDQRREVSERIKALRGKKTVLVITHDLELIEGMDLILVFKRVERPPEDEEEALLAMEAMPPAGVAKGAAIGKGEGMPKGGMPIAKGAAAGKGEGMPIAKGAVAGKGVAMGAPIAAKGGPAPKGGDAAPPEQREHGIIVEQGSWTELSQRGHAFRILAGMEQPRA